MNSQKSSSSSQAMSVAFVDPQNLVDNNQISSPKPNEQAQPNDLAKMQQYPQSDQHLPTTFEQSELSRTPVSQSYSVPQAGSSQQQMQPTTTQQYPMTTSTNVNILQQTSQPHIVTVHPIKPLLENDTPIESSNDPRVPSPAQNHTPSSSPQKAIITKVKLSDELNIFDWFRTTDIINQIAEKAKSSVDSVITTLDPGMKEYLYSGGNINIMVMSDSNCLISSIRDAFQSVFGRATVVAARCGTTKESIDYPIKLANGFEQAVFVATEKIKKLRLDTNNVPQNQVIAIVQPSLVSIGKNDCSNSNNIAQPQDDMSTTWFLTYCMLVEDPVLKLTISCLSQFIPLDKDVVARAAQESIYPNEFNDKHLGFSVSIDQLMNSKLQIKEVHNNDFDNYGCAWLPKWSGNTETQLIHQLGLSLANAYRRRWNDCVRIETMS